MLRKALAKAPADRFQSAGELKTALESACGVAPTFRASSPSLSPLAGRPSSSSHRTVPPVSFAGADAVAGIRTRRTLVTSAAGAAIALLAVFLLRHRQPPAPPPTHPPAVAAAAAAPAPAIAATGTLDVQVEPSARIFVDGELVGEGRRVAVTALAPLPARHAVRIEAEGRTAWEGSAALAPGERHPLEITLPPLAARAHSKPTHAHGKKAAKGPSSTELTIDPYAN